MFGPKPNDKAEWLRGLLETHERPLLRYALRLVKDSQLAKDIVQETFLRLWKTDVEEVERPAEWLYTVCRNRAFDVVRKDKRMKSPRDAQQLEEVPDTAPLASNVLELRQAQTRILAAIEHLSENQQEVVRLKFQSGLSYKEMSRVTGLSESNVGFLLHTALTEIRARVRGTRFGRVEARRWQMTQAKHNDPRITAYALGELEGAELKQFETEMQNDPSLRGEVLEMRNLSILLSAELNEEPAPEFSKKERAAIVPPRPFVSTPLRWGMGFGGALLAACLVFILRNEIVPPEMISEKVAQVEEKKDDKNEGDALSAPSGAAGGAVLAEKKASRAMAPAPSADAPTTSHAYAKPTRRGMIAQGIGRARDESGLDSSVSRPTEPSKKNRKAKSDPAAAKPSDAAEAESFNTEAYSRIEDNAFIPVSHDPRSTFSIDVDTASYANVRRFLESGRRPPKDAVRIEELVNYFTYSYPQPTDGKPFAVHTEVNVAPWNGEHRLVRIGLKGKEIPWAQRPGSNLVFLIDVSGSMDAPNRLPLVVESLNLLVDKLDRRDHVAIVVYAGASGLVLPSTSGADKKTILSALDRLSAGGSTNGAAGIQLAYDTAMKTFVKGGINRVVIATDGDFNVGVSSEGELTRLIEAKAKTGVFLSVLGFGMDNYKDAQLEKLADKGHGNYAYIDTLKEAKKVLVQELAGTLFTIAKDVKIQVEFNPAVVGAYRLIGYENRIMAHQDFNDDKKDAGDIGSGHTVTALYEIVPKGKAIDAPPIDPLKYQTETKPLAAGASNELMTVKLRYKKPDGDKSDLMEVPVRDRGAKLSEASPDFRFAAAVASYGMLLRDSKYKGTSSWEQVLDGASPGVGHEEIRAEFLGLVHKAKAIPAK